MTAYDEAFTSLLEKYASATKSSDSAAYSRLFAEDAIRMPPGANPEYGPDEIQRGEQADYDVARWDPTFTAHNVLPIGNDWLYGIADVDVVTVGSR